MKVVCVENNDLHSQLADNVKGNVAAAKTKVEQIARGIDIGEKGTLGDLLFGPDQVSPFTIVFSNVSSNCLKGCKLQTHKSHYLNLLCFSTLVTNCTAVNI